jgi:hypothetical protein
MNTERFETAWVIPKLSAILPRLRKGEQSFTSYKKVFSSAEGDFLRKLREVYATKPSSEALAGAIAARQDMGLPAVRSLYDDEGDPQWNLLLKDISSFETLLEKLTKKYSARAVMRDALFGPSGASLKSVSKKPAR